MGGVQGESKAQRPCTLHLHHIYCVMAINTLYMDKWAAIKKTLLQFTEALIFSCKCWLGGCWAFIKSNPSNGPIIYQLSRVATVRDNYNLIIQNDPNTPGKMIRHSLSQSVIDDSMLAAEAKGPS